MTLMECISMVSNNYIHSDIRSPLRDLCSIRDYSSTCILTSTELSFSIEYICTI